MRIHIHHYYHIYNEKQIIHKLNSIMTKIEELQEEIVAPFVVKSQAPIRFDKLIDRIEVLFIIFISDFDPESIKQKIFPIKLLFKLLKTLLVMLMEEVKPLIEIHPA